MRSSLTRRELLAAGSGLAAAAALPALSGCSSLASADSDPDTLVVHTQLGTTAPGSPRISRPWTASARRTRG